VKSHTIITFRSYIFNCSN